ncbi:hypothetical protein KJ596_00685, partial [Patescibacteria group bacterium]|nr:hypothetical protein [Patescibacteria group bacterium]
MKLIRTQRLLIGILFGLVGIGLVLGIGGSLREIVSAQGMNTVVFTGQVIPAYEGAAYDPTVAYQYLSGLPIYVFVYDNWRPGGGDDWVVNNLVVRTQIRADGTFQVMGLPHGANFGVYFPFQEICYSGANYTGSVVECWGTPATRRVERADGLSTPPLIAPFRSPWLQRTGRTDFAGVLSVPGQEYGDGIADVFSYGFLECSIDDVGGNMEDCHSVTAYDQFGQEIVIQEEFVFITSTNRLDIQSHINVFPLIPATVLNVSMRLCDQIKGVGHFSCGDGGNMELHAEQVVRRAYPKEYRILYEDADCTESGTGY